MHTALLKTSRIIIVLFAIIIIAINASHDAELNINQNKLSMPVAEARELGQTFPTTAAENIFRNYATWTQGQRINRTSLWKILTTIGEASGVTSSTGLTALTPVHQFIDLNGDGLDDLLYYNEEKLYKSQMAVFINKGNLIFDIAYKCYYTGYPSYLAYGDCATNETVFDPTTPPTTPVSTTPRVNDPLSYLSLLKVVSGDTRRLPYTFTDINGDGLIDFLYHKSNKDEATRSEPVASSYYILLNQGNLNFRVGYRCGVTINYITNVTYRGDCAL